MIPTEFGIIEDIEEKQDYSQDFCYRVALKKYQCVCIDDDLYINDWWDKLVLLKTYSDNLNCPIFGLSRWGITLIPPESLPGFQAIVLSDKRINEDIHLRELADKIQDAINRNKFMIHIGV